MSFASAIAEKLIGQDIEVYVAPDSHDQLAYADFNTSNKSIIYGKLVEVIDDCLVLEVVSQPPKRRGQDQVIKSGKVYVNAVNVSTIGHPASGVSLQDAYVSAPNNANLTKGKM